MAVSEQERNRLYNRAIELFGEEEAAILMAHLPPGGYPNLATRQDLLELEARLRGSMQSFTLRTVLTANISLAAVVAAIAFSAANLA